MKRILLLTGVFVLAAVLAFAQRIPVEFSVGVGGYFPHDGRYTHFFDHNPANFSLQAAYGWRAFDLKAGLDRLRKSTNGGDEFSLPERTYDTVIAPDTFSVRSTNRTSTSVNSYVRASGFRFGAAFHPFREAAFSPFIGFGASIFSSKGHGDSVKVSYDSIYVGSPDTLDRVDTTQISSGVAQFSESVFGTYIEAGVQTRLPHNLFFVFEAIRDFRANDKATLLGPIKGGGTVIQARLGYRF